MMRRATAALILILTLAERRFAIDAGPILRAAKGHIFVLIVSLFTLTVTPPVALAQTCAAPPGCSDPSNPQKLPLIFASGVPDVYGTQVFIGDGATQEWCFRVDGAFTQLDINFIDKTGAAQCFWAQTVTLIPPPGSGLAEETSFGEQPHFSYFAPGTIVPKGPWRIRVTAQSGTTCNQAYQVSAWMHGDGSSLDSCPATSSTPPPAGPACPYVPAVPMHLDSGAAPKNISRCPSSLSRKPMNKDPKWNKAQSLGLSPAFAVDTGVSTGNVNKYCFVLDQPVDSLRFATGGRANPSSTTTGICGTHTMKVTFPDGTVGTAGPNADNTLQYPSGVFPAGEYQIDFEQVTPCPGASDSLFLFHVKYGLPLAEQCAPPVPGGPTPSPSPSPGPSTPSAPVTGSLFGKDCNPLVLNNVYARAEAFVARDLAYSRQTIRHPDSSILVSCFPQYAKVVSKRSGDVFSGNFRDPLGDVIGDTMGALGINFVDSYLFDIPAFAAAVPLLRQFLGKDVLIGGDPDPGSFCQVPDLLWAQATTNGTIRDKLRYISFRELLNKEYAGLGDIAQENLDEDELIMFAVPQTEADLDALKPQLAPVVDYYGAYSLEEVLYRAGIPVTP